MTRLETTVKTIEETKQVLLREIGALQIEERIRRLAEQEIMLHALAAERYIHKLYGGSRQEEREEDESIYERGSDDPADREFYRSCHERLRYHVTSLKEVPRGIKRDGLGWKPMLAYDPATTQQVV